MGQAWTDIRNKFHGRELRERQLKEISDRVFNHFTAGKDYLSLEDLYIAVLLVFNDINKHFPGPHTDPPSKQEVQERMKLFRRNVNDQFDREEFSQFIKEAYWIFSRELREIQLKEISDRVFNHFIADPEKHYSLEDLYIAVLWVFNDLNKHFPGPHTDPPSKQEVQERMKLWDINLNDQFDREEFSQYIKEAYNPYNVESQPKFDNRCGSSSSHCIDDEKGHKRGT